ncbi:MAG: YhdH/YhfP family quinone oxidoreductase [Gammaproteobacteria bacterium]
MTTQFRGWRVHKRNGTTEAVLETLRENDLGVGTVTIQAEYSSLNYKDALALTGKGKIMHRFPLVAGIDVAGRVADSDDPRFSVGDPVLVTGCGLGEDTDGGFAEYVRVAAEHVIPIPRGLDARSAMQLGTAGFTVGLAIERLEHNGLRAGCGQIAVTGASGGVGALAVAMLAQCGYHVMALTSGADAYDWLKDLGAAEVLDSLEPGFGERALESARYAGAIDTVGGDLLARLLPVIDWWGSVAAIGNAGGAEFTATVYPFILRGISLLGVNSVATPRLLRSQVWKRLANELRPHKLDSIAAHEIALADVMEAAEDLIAGSGPRGRTLIRIH